jgi:phospholipid transport system transporter-binding protein
MSLSYSQQGDRLVLQGELSRSTIPAMWQKRQQWLQGAISNATLNIDLAGVERVDSAGVAMLLRLKGALQQQQCDLVIVASNPQLRAIAAVSGVTDILQLSTQ